MDVEVLVDVSVDVVPVGDEVIVEMEERVEVIVDIVAEVVMVVDVSTVVVLVDVDDIVLVDLKYRCGASCRGGSYGANGDDRRGTGGCAGGNGSCCSTCECERCRDEWC